MKISLRLLFLISLFFSSITYAQVYKCAIDGRTIYSHNECWQYSFETSADKKRYESAVRAGFDGFLDSSYGKRLTCAESIVFNNTHDVFKTMSSCSIGIDGCVEGTCRVGVWRDISRTSQ
ncbi:hypothetical protein W01_05430 [Candidatus Nitrotoga sp. AM1P]|nr:hypothetical protein W01_05430 [Candidatus Nitrotoga sp. AM1P]